MKILKVYNLNKFALEQLFRPYRSMLGFEKRLDKLPCKLDEVPALLIKDNAWRNVVLSRLSKIPFDVPDYVYHGLITYLQSELPKFGMRFSDRGHGFIKFRRDE